MSTDRNSEVRIEGPEELIQPNLNPYSRREGNDKIRHNKNENMHEEQKALIFHNVTAAKHYRYIANNKICATCISLALLV